MYCLPTESDGAEPFDLPWSDGARSSDPASGPGVQVLQRSADPNQGRCIQSLSTQFSNVTPIRLVPEECF